jgi:hypothetical protein
MKIIKINYKINGQTKARLMLVHFVPKFGLYKPLPFRRWYFFLSRCNAQACLLVEYKNVLNDGCIDTD